MASDEEIMDQKSVGERPTWGANHMTNYNHKDNHYENDCDDCAFYMYDKEAGKIECAWCNKCKLHHDWSGRTHADWSNICSCGCRCLIGQSKEEPKKISSIYPPKDCY